MTNSIVATRPPGGEWTVLGRGHHNPGHTPQGESWGWNQWGPDTGSFTIRGRPDRPDLALGAPVRVLAHGGCVWGGRVRGVAPQAGGMLAVACEGHQYALDDDPWRRTFMRDRITGFIDRRAIPGLNLNTTLESALVSGAITLGWPSPARAIGTNEELGVVLDLGQADAKGIAVDYVGLANTSANLSFYVNGWDNWQCTSGGVTAYSSATNAMTAPAATVTGTFSTPKRYVALSLYCPSGYTPSFPPTMQITGVRIASDAGYLSSGASVLVAGHVLDSVAADLSWINPDTSRRTATATAIPHLTTEDAYESHRATLQRANAWHDWVLMVDQWARLVHQPRPQHATLQLGAWSGDGAFQDSGRDLNGAVNQVIVSGTDPAGATVHTTATNTSSPLTKAGITRTRVLDVNASLNSTDAAAIGAVWVARMSTNPTRGATSTTGSWVLRDPFTGATIPPAVAMTRIGELIRISGDTNPDTGGVGRHGAMQAATWTPATNNLTLTLDAPNDHIDALLTRIQATRATLPAI